MDTPKDAIEKRMCGFVLQCGASTVSLMLESMNEVVEAIRHYANLYHVGWCPAYWVGDFGPHPVEAACKVVVLNNKVVKLIDGTLLDMMNFKLEEK